MTQEPEQGSRGSGPVAGGIWELEPLLVEFIQLGRLDQLESMLPQHPELLLTRSLRPDLHYLAGLSVRPHEHCQDRRRGKED